MALSCAIIPTIKDSTGKERESTLFKDLLKYTGYNRPVTKDIYSRVKNPAFTEDTKSVLSFDDLGEPTISSLYEKAGLDKLLDKGAVMKEMKRGLEAVNSEGREREFERREYDLLIRRVNKFNRENPFRRDYVADVIPVEGGTLKITVEPRTEQNKDREAILGYDEALNNRLRDIMAEAGVTYGTLTELEERRGLTGITDFSVARDAATGIAELIRIARGEKGQAALPEEFAHFALAALGNNPLAVRLINLSSDPDIQKSVFGDQFDNYRTAYKNDSSMMAKEAAGKLLAKHLLKGEKTEGLYKSLIDRVISAVKNLFSKITSSKIEQAIIEADREAGALAGKILTGEMNKEMKLENISESSQFYSLSEKVDKEIPVIQRIINSELKRLAIYKRRNPNDKLTRDQLLLIDNLERSRDAHMEKKGIFLFMKNALNYMKEADKALNDLNRDSTLTTKDKASGLRDLRETISSYNTLIQYIQDDISQEEIGGEEAEYTSEMKAYINELSGISGKVFSKYRKMAIALFTETMRPVIGDKIVVPIGKFRDREYTLEELIASSDSDISVFSRWLDSMADSSDIIHQGIDRIVKRQRDKARKKTIEYQKELVREGLILEQSGTKGFDFMFKKDKNGNLTGKYITEADQDKYSEAKKKMYSSLHEKYKETRFGINKKAYWDEVNAWYDQNTDIVGDTRVPKLSIYGDPDFKKMTAPQRRFYDKVMEIKADLDSMLPEGVTSIDNAVQIRKDLVERIQNASGVKGGVREVVKSIKDSFVSRVDDTGFSRTLIDSGGNEIQELPIYYVSKLEDPSQISTDVVSTLSAYASMALDYNYMGEILDEIEIGRDVLYEREIQQTKGGNPVMESFRSAGREVVNKLTKRGRGVTNFTGRLDDYFQMQVYGKYMNDEGDVLGVSLAKLANNINRYTSANNLGLNLLAGISNVATGSVMMNVESFTGEFFGAKDTATADRKYMKLLPEHLAGIGNRVKTDKLSLWDEYFDVMQDFDKKVYDTGFNRRNWFTKLLGSNAVFFINTAGEHWMQNRTSMALANKIKVKDERGNTIPLFDAYEVVTEKKDGKTVKAFLRLKKGITKEDGTKWTEEDEFNFKQKAAAINQGMHGIYNKADRSAIQKLAVGRLAMLYRKWIRPNYMKRFKAARYNMDLGQWTQGYYNTAFGFIYTLMKDLRRMQFHLAAHYQELTKEEKYNLRRAAIEVGHFIGLVAFLGLMDWEDDKERPWHMQMLEYQSRRLYTELGAQIPGLQMIEEAGKILKQPAAGINTIQNIINTFKIVMPGSLEEIQTGRYKGYTRAEKYLLELIPMRRTVMNALNPDETLAFFKSSW